MKITTFKNKKTNRDMWTTTYKGKKYVADVTKYPTQSDFEKYVHEKIKNKWPDKFFGEGDYRGQSFQKIEEYAGYMIYMWWNTSSPKTKTFDLFPATMDNYPTPEDFQDPAYYVMTYAAAKELIESLIDN